MSSMDYYFQGGVFWPFLKLDGHGHYDKGCVKICRNYFSVSQKKIREFLQTIALAIKMLCVRFKNIIFK